MEFVDFFIFFFFFPPFEEAPTKEMEVEVEENGASAGRGEVFQGREGGAEMEVEDGEDGGTDAAPARPASADAIKQMMLAHERGHQAHGGVPGGGSTMQQGRARRDSRAQARTSQARWRSQAMVPW